MVDEEEEDEVDVKSKLANQSMIVCNICSRRFVNKADMSLHVRSAHFGMKEDNQESLEVIQVDDRLDDELSSESDDEMTIDSDSVCRVCYCIFKDSIDLEAHTSLAHPTISKSQPSNSESDPINLIIDSDQPNASADPLKTSNVENPFTEPTESCPTSLIATGANHENLAAEPGETTSTALDPVAVPLDSQNDQVNGLHDTIPKYPKRLENSGDKKDPPIDKNDLNVIIDDNVSNDLSVPSAAKNYERVVCNICVQEFETKETLNVHIKSDHFGISSYKCAMCSISFESRDQVIKHYNNCNGENQVEKNVEGQLMEAKVTIKGKAVKHNMKKDRRKKKFTRKKVKKKTATRKKVKKKTALNESSRVSARIADKAKKLSEETKDDYDTGNMPSSMSHQVSKLRKRTASQTSIRKIGMAGKATDQGTANQKSIRKIGMAGKANDQGTANQKSIRKRGMAGKANNQGNKVLCKKAAFVKQFENNVQALGHETLRPCFICGQRFYSTNNELDHMIQKHCEYKKPTSSQLSLLTLRPDEKFKCLRCGKVGVLSVIQCHLQGKCLRSPFNGVKALKNFYCTVCGEHFEEAHLHDIHVASVHYSHLFDPDSGHFASIPFPHILLYHISPKVCQHCGKNCQFTIKSRTAVERAFLQQVSCIEGPYVCPYAHTTRQSRCTLDLLLHHLKFCAYRAGVLALQCNNCFKMLLCNNTPEQVDQLREIVKTDHLECCSKTEKSFKCYCCTYDYSWSVVTGQLKASIKRLDHIRSYPANDAKVQRILTLNPSVHTKGPQLIAKKLNGLTNSFNSMPPRDNENDNKNTSFPLDVKINLEPKRRKTSFDVIESNLAQIQQKGQKSLLAVNEKKSVGDTDQKPSASIRAPPKEAVLDTAEPIKITNTFKPSEQPKTMPIIDETAQIEISDESSMYQTVIPNTHPKAKHVTSNILPTPSLKSFVQENPSLESSVMLGTKTNVGEYSQERAQKRAPLAKKLIKSQPYIIEEINYEIQPTMRFNQTKMHDSVTQELPVHTKQDVSKHNVTGWKPLLLGGKVPDADQRVKICRICYAKPHQSRESRTKSLFYSERSFLNHMMMKHQKEVNVNENQRGKTPHHIMLKQDEIGENRGKPIEPSDVLETIKETSDALTSRESLARKDVACNRNDAESKQALEGGKAPPPQRLSVCKICISRSSSSTKPIFYDEGSLVLHMMEHSREQRQEFTCYDCDTKYTDQSLWKHHIRFHHPYCVIMQCDYKNCTMEFQRPQDLQDHIFSEHSHTFGCAVCLAMFRSEEELKIHSDVLHGMA